MGNKFPRWEVVRVLTLVVCAVLASAIACAAATVTVDCSNAKAKIKTIGAGLALLPLNGPNTLLVSGTCNENVMVENHSYLTIQGNPTATIDGSGNPAAPALGIFSSHYVTVNDLTIDGGTGTLCSGQSICSFNRDTFQNSQDMGVRYDDGTSGTINASTIQNNPFSDGLGVLNGVTVSVFGSTVQGNGTDPSCGSDCGGIFLARGSAATIDPFGPTSTVIQNHTAAYGIRMINATLTMRRTTVSGNGTDGVQLFNGSIAGIGGNVSITSNGGRGIRIGDLSLAGFGGAPTVTGNSGGAEQVWCDGQFAATRNVATVDPGTNCPAEPASVP